MRLRTLVSGGLTVWMVASRPAGADSVDDYIRRAMTAAHIPAAAVVITRAGEPPKISAYGNADIERNVPATPDTAFQLASATKLFTGILTMRMVEDGKLALSDPVSKYIADTPPAWREMTVMQLASHSSGFPDAIKAGPFDDVHAVRKWTAAQPVLAGPGTQSVYSQTEFAMLTEILERVSGRSFDALLSDQIILPLGLTATRYSYLNDTSGDPGSSVVSAGLVPGRATLYKWTGKEQVRYEYTYPEWTHANAGLFTSAADLAKVFEALQSGKLLHPASMQALAKAYVLKSGQNATFGVAWIVRHRRGRLAIGHSGGPGLSDIWIYPDRGLSVAVLINGHNFFPILADQVAEVVDPAEPPKHEQISDTDQALSKRLERWTSEISSGEPDPGMIEPNAAADLQPLLSMLGPTVAAFGVPKTWRLTSETTDANSKRSRSYIAAYDIGELVWKFELTSENKIISAFATPD